MILRRAQAGAVGALLIALLVIVMVVLIAAQMLSRLSDTSREEGEAVAGLQRAMAALEAYASVAQRLPCPADPELDTGIEVVKNATDCKFPEGTLPWLTIGLRRDDAYDPWARKLSYRVYSGGADSLTQVGGVSMVNCDTSDAGPTVAGGLCNPGASVYERNTSPANFLAGKGYKLKDMAATVNDVAFVIMSHGSTGLGGYTVSGARLPDPKGNEKKNTNATGEFFIEAHSGNDVEATLPAHFDDLLVYRRLADLVERIKLGARDWPEYGTSSLVFDAPTVSAALGAPVTTGDLGRTTLNLSGARITGESGSSTPTNLSFDDTIGANAGIGVATGGSNLIESSANEFLRIDFTSGAKRFGVTLNDFGYYGFLYFELVQFRFFLDDVQLSGSPVLAIACQVDGGLASFTFPLDQTFNRVEIVPLPASYIFGGTGITAFLVSEVKACTDTTSECRTALDLPANRCS